jgi:hypothetical protein
MRATAPKWRRRDPDQNRAGTTVVVVARALAEQTE